MPLAATKSKYGEKNLRKSNILTPPHLLGAWDSSEVWATLRYSIKKEVQQNYRIWIKYLYSVNILYAEIKIFKKKKKLDLSDS